MSFKGRRPDATRDVALVRFLPSSVTTGRRFRQDGEIGVVLAFGDDESAVLNSHGQGRHGRDGLAVVIAGGDGDGLPFQAGSRERP